MPVTGNKNDDEFLMNANIDFKYVDQNLRNQNNSYTLSILSHQDGFVFYIYSKANNYLVHFEKRSFPPSPYLADFLKITQNLINELKKVFDITEIRYLYAANKITVIPSAIFDESQKEELYALNFENIEQYLVKSYFNKNYECVVLFPVPHILDSLNKEINISIKYYNQIVPFMEFVAVQPSENGPEMFINVLPDSLQLMVIKNHQLLFLNSFHYHSNTDFLYIILNVQKQLNINKNDLIINILGIESKSDEKLKSLPHFIEKVYFYKDLKLKYNMAIKQEYIIENLNFLNLYLCE